MTDQPGPESIEIEQFVARTIADQTIAKSEVLRIIAGIPSNIRFTRNSTWIALLHADVLEQWRKLESYKLLINRCLVYPCDLEFFLKEAIAVLGVYDNQITNVSKAQQVPILRKLGELTFRVELPFSTPDEPVAIFYTVNRSTNTVEQASVYQSPLS